jgi:Fe-S cluster assembly ATP-binding protein
MQQEILNIRELLVKVQDKDIISGLDLVIRAGETHALMGPNGSGKSTLAQSIAGGPGYKIDAGKIVFGGKDITELSPDERARLGVFLSFQYPLEITGVNVASLLRLIYNKKFGQNIMPVKFRELLKEKMEIIDMKPEFAERYLNEGFSGGEKKKMEILQMLLLEPKLVILDEVDSGLDIDALKSVSVGVNWLRRKNPETAFIIITHYARILEYIKPDYVHVMRGGRVVKSGGFEVAQKLEADGYKEFGPDE